MGQDPEVGLNNEEIYQLARKTVPGCGTKNAVMTYIRGLGKRDIVKKQGGCFWSTRLMLPTGPFVGAQELYWAPMLNSANYC